jgi:hypothetical protein
MYLMNGLNATAAQNTNATPSLLNLDAIVLRPLALGHHKCKLINYALQTVTAEGPGKGNQYLSCIMHMDNEPANRNKAVFAKELQFMCSGLSKQFDTADVSQAVLLNMAKEQEFDIWVVLAENQMDPSKPYYNWYYQEPAAPSDAGSTIVIESSPNL